MKQLHGGKARSEIPAHQYIYGGHGNRPVQLPIIVDHEEEDGDDLDGDEETLTPRTVEEESIQNNTENSMTIEHSSQNTHSLGKRHAFLNIPSAARVLNHKGLPATCSDFNVMQS